jgi:hypothetical protein
MSEIKSVAIAGVRISKNAKTEMTDVFTRLLAALGLMSSKHLSMQTSKSRFSHDPKS